VGNVRGGGLTRVRVLALAVSASSLVAAQAQDDGSRRGDRLTELSTVEVIGTTLLPGLDVPLRDVPANVQSFGPQTRSGSGSVADLLERNAGSVTLNSAQGNPNQPDLSFRGFVASPLLGLPQGLSVFQDGVRINEAFGDGVNWDLLPPSAISSLQLIPGSNPVFGLNTLGGALTIHTKSGRTDPGGSLQVQGGSFGRASLEFEQGGVSQDRAWDYFLTGNLLRDGGWAAHNASRIARLFAKVGHHTAGSDIDLGLTLADNTLQGTQTLPQSFSSDIRQAYTYPDRNRNRLGMLTLTSRRELDAQWVLGFNAYYRSFRNENISSNVNAGFGQVDPETRQADSVQGNNDRSALRQSSWGGGLQLSYSATLAGHRNQLVLGTSTDRGRADFTQESQPAAFNADRGADPAGPFRPETDARSRNQSDSFFLSDVLALGERWTATVSGRYDLSRVRIEDRSGDAPGLDGRHRFSRFNPALGLNFNPVAGTTFYAGYSEGMRAPTAMELTCADPAAPCKLPNSFLSDPPLRPVIAQTVEAGARGKVGANATWSAALWRTELRDDIQFISSQGRGTNTGFFQNVGRTRRQGIELAGSDKWDRLAASVRYSFVDATYRSGFIENSPVNSGADNGTIAVLPGNRISGIPRHQLKVRLDYVASGRWSMGSSLVAVSSSYARGDENNGDSRGRVPGYAVVHVDTSYQIAPDTELFARVDNLFDRRYANFATLGRNAFAGSDRSFDPVNAVGEQFRGYGAPRGIWIGMRTHWR
jgi:iron complex outermembrane receptor protein